MITQLKSWAAALGGDVRGRGVLCPGPGHSARDRSLSVTPSAAAPDGFLVHSFSGDDPIACKDYVRAKLGQPEFKPNGHAKPAKKTYFDYRDETGAVIYQVERTDYYDGRKKKFLQRRPDGNGGWIWNLDGVHPVPYRLPELLEALALGRTIVIVEGEAKADLLWSWNIPSTCNSGGEEKWRAEHSAYLSGADTVVLPDNDPPGRLHLDAVAASLKEAGASVRVPDLPGLGAKGDVVDWAAAGGTREQLDALIENTARPWAQPNGHATTQKPPGLDLHVFNPADWEGKKAPPRLWDVPDYIPHGIPALLYADGGTGKGYLGLQLAVARAVSKEWIGLMPEPGRTLVLSTEDDIDEMWRRIEGMLPFYDASMKDLADIRLVDLVGENSVLGLLSKGIIEPTPMYRAIDAFIADFKPGMVILDVLADLFSGEENNRPQVTQFIGLLKRLCRKHNCTIPCPHSLASRA
jgi:hypothetical protein